MIKADLNNREFNALTKQLSKVGKKLASDALTRSARAGVGVYRSDIRKNLPTKSGDLRKSITVKTIKRPGYRVFKLGFRKKLGWYANFIEYGTKPHQIRAKNKKGLFFGGYKKINHPGTKKQEIVTNAFSSSNSKKATEIIRKKLAVELRKLKR